MDDFRKEFLKEKEDWEKHVEEWSQASTAIFTSAEKTSVTSTAKKPKKTSKAKKSKFPKENFAPIPFELDVKHKAVEPKIKGGSFGPQPVKRLFTQKEDMRELLYPDIDKTRGIRKGTAVMRPPISFPKNKGKLILVILWLIDVITINLTMI
jgi:hypothetical protein